MEQMKKNKPMSGEARIKLNERSLVLTDNEHHSAKNKIGISEGIVFLL
jgi:hypothetical protein